MTDFEKIYSEYYDTVFQYTLSLCRNEKWAEEITQTAFFKALRSINTFRGECKLSVWLCQIAKHILYQELRRKKHMETVELTDYMADDSVPDGEASILHQENRIELYRAVHHLPEIEREVVLYRITGELSFREIGSILGKSENWSRTVFYRAKQKIRKELNKNE